MTGDEQVTDRPALRRRLGVGAAVVVGLGAMLGAGVFTVLAPAAAHAGGLLYAGLGLAAVVAFANATSTADLAAAHPESGGAYVYGRERLGPWWGRLAGWAFLSGKTASAATGALVLAAYTVPAAHPDAGGWRLAVALTAIAVATGLNVAGVRWTVGATAVLVAGTLAALAVVVVAGLVLAPAAPASTGTDGSALGVLTAAGLLFFAFAGYARIATLGEEVRDPARTIPRAVPVALAVAVAVYALVAAAALRALGTDGLAGSVAPLADVVRAARLPALVGVVVAGSVVAAGSVLLSVLVGVSRTGLAMARRSDLPPALAAIGRAGTPWRADLAGGVVAAVLVVALADPAAAVAVSAFCVLVYYAVANAAALRLDRDERRWPVAVPVVGLIGCVLLAAVLPVGWLG